MSKHKIKDLIILLSLLVLAPLLSILFRVNLLTAIFLFYILPSAFLTLREPKFAKRAFIFSCIAAALFFIIDYIAVLDGAWWVSTIFPFRFFDLLPIEDTIWFFSATYLVVMFYEYFDDRGPHKTSRTRIKYLATIVCFALIGLFISIALYPKILIIDYAYFWIGIIFSIIPSIIILLKYPKLRFKFLRTNLYIFCLHLPFELIALKLNLWSFPGNHFIGWVELAGVRFPLEELIVYISLTGIAGLAYWEFYGDDCN